MEESGPSEALHELLELLAKNFPQHGPIEPEVTVSHQSKEDGAPLYIGRIKLFEQMLISTGEFETDAQAREGILKTAMSVLSEFITIQRESVPEAIRNVVDNLGGTMQQFDARRDEKEAGFEAPQSIDGGSLKGVHAQSSGAVQIIRPSDSDLFAAEKKMENPVSFLAVLSSKMRNGEPIYQSFVGASNCHGCSLTYNGEKITVGAAYPRISEAKMAAAKQYCDRHYHQLGVVFSGPSQEPTTVQVDKSEVRASDPATDAVSLRDTGQGSQQPVTGTGYVSMLNSMLQKNSVQMPEFLFDRPTQTSFVCRIKDYAGLSVESMAYTRKGLAKEDAAKQMHMLLYEKFVSKSLKIPAQALAPGVPLPAAFSGLHPAPPAHPTAIGSAALHLVGPPLIQSSMPGCGNSRLTLGMEGWNGHGYPLQAHARPLLAGQEHFFQAPGQFSPQNAGLARSAIAPLVSPPHQQFFPQHGQPQDHQQQVPYPYPGHYAVPGYYQFPGVMPGQPPFGTVANYGSFPGVGFAGYSHYGHPLPPDYQHPGMLPMKQHQDQHPLPEPQQQGHGQRPLEQASSENRRPSESV